jgi:hypothetical protein
MKRAHLTLINGGPCPCEACRTQRWLLAVSLLTLAAVGAVWLLLGTA